MSSSGILCSNITDYFSTRKITTPKRRNTYSHSPIQNKYALTKARTPYVILKPIGPTNTHNNNILHGGSRDDKKRHLKVKKTKTPFKGLKNENNI